jgi:hypothetical protein
MIVTFKLSKKARSPVRGRAVEAAKARSPVQRSVGGVPEAYGPDVCMVIPAG